jgi:hypothetical protein
MVSRSLRVCFILSIAFVCGFEIHTSTGIVGVTRKSRATAFFHGCICHGDSASPNVRVWINGPDSLPAGQEGLYRVSVAKNVNIAAGFNVATFRGALGIVDSSETQLLRPDNPDSPELTHCFPKLSHGRDTISWLFFYRSPLSVGFLDTLYSCCNSVDTSLDPSGDFWNFGANFRIRVTAPAGVNGDPQVAHIFSLSQNYPNPFNSTTTIRFTIPVGASGHASLRVYDVTGKTVATLTDEKKWPGTYGVHWNAEGFPSGVYFYRLDVGGRNEIKKLVLLR